MRRLLENPDDVIDQPHERHKLWPRRHDRDIWPAVMGDTVPDCSGCGDHLHLQARHYFADSIREAAAEIDARTERTTWWTPS